MRQVKKEALITVYEDGELIAVVTKIDRSNIIYKCERMDFDEIGKLLEQDNDVPLDIK